MDDAVRERFVTDRHGTQMGGHHFVLSEHSMFAKALRIER